MKDMNMVRSNIVSSLLAFLFATCIQTIAVNSSQFDQNDEIITLGNKVISSAHSKANSTNHLLVLIMQSLLLDYHVTKTHNDSQQTATKRPSKGQLREEQLKAWIKHLATEHEAFPIKTMRTILTQQLQDPIFQDIVDLEKCNQIFDIYTNTMQETNKLMLLSTIHAFICSYKFLLESQEKKATIAALLDIASHKHNVSLFSYRDVQKERKIYATFNVLCNHVLKNIRNPSEKAGYMRIFNTLNSLRLACTKEVKVITAKKITYEREAFESNIVITLAERTRKLLQAAGIRSVKYNEHSMAMQSLLHAYKTHIIAEKTRHLEYQDHKMYIVKVSGLTSTTFYILTYIMATYTSAGGHSIPFIEETKFLSILLFGFVMISNIFNYALFILDQSAKHEKHIK